MKKAFLFFIAPFLLNIFLSCNSTEKKTKAKETKKQAENVSINTIYKLPKELEEISGISFIDSINLLTVQDEEGYIYLYNLKQENIIEKIKFAEPGDYEDVIVVEKDAYVVSSSGKIFHIQNFRNENRKIQIYSTPLSAKNNIEGLAYDKSATSLLLASKDEGIDNDEDKEIYAFDLKTYTFNTTPVYSINLEKIANYFKGDELVETSKKFLKALGNRNMNDVFKPTALTIHPKTNEIFVLSSTNNLIAVLNRQGQLKKIIELEGKEFTQPEGIAFSPDGKLYISNEGSGKKGNIIHLNYEH